MHTTKGHPASTLSFYVIPAYAHLILQCTLHIEWCLSILQCTLHIEWCLSTCGSNGQGEYYGILFYITKTDSKQSLSGPFHASTCLYQDVNDPLPCYEWITCDDITVHMKSRHGIGGMSPQSPINCAWNGCALLVSRNNLVRHIREAHLGYERRR